MTGIQTDYLTEGLKTYIPLPLLDFFATVRIGIIGCGGLGSNCAFMLVRSGFRNFELMDGDCVEPSNLNRQMFFPRQVGQPKAEALKELLMELSPALDIQARNTYYHPKVEPGLFKNCHYLLEAVDKADTKAEILNSCPAYNRWIATASGLGGCKDISRIGTRTLRGKRAAGEDSPVIVMAGDGVHETGPKNPPLMPGVVTTAAAQVHALMKQAVKESGYDWE